MITPQPISTRATCRVCGAAPLESVLSLGEHYVSNFVEATDQASLKAPLELVLCNKHAGGCGLLQLKDTVSAEAMYRNYWYRSGVNETMRAALADITRRIREFVPLSPADIVIDIGSNDNTLLQSYHTPGLRLIGFEPATSILPYAAAGATHVINDFFSSEQYHRLGLGKPAKVITAIAMFYDLEDPNIFVADIVKCLDANGLLIIQMAYLPLMLRDNIFDNICHEHLEYYSLLSLEQLLDRHGLRIIDVEINDVNGGSLRAYITSTNSHLRSPIPGSNDRIKNLRAEENALGLNSLRPYQDFARRVNGIKEQVTGFIQQAVSHGRKIYVYGASTKGNTLLQYFGLDHHLITAAADRNPDKWGRKTVGTGIPIISEEEARSAQPNYFLVLPWHFLPEFIKREQAWLQSGGQFIVPLPEFKIIGWKDGITHASVASAKSISGVKI